MILKEININNLSLISASYLSAVFLIFQSNKSVDYRFLGLYSFLFLIDIFLMNKESTRNIFNMMISAGFMGFLIEFFGCYFDMWRFSSDFQPPLYVIFSWPLVFCFMYGVSRRIEKWTALFQ